MIIFGYREYIISWILQMFSSIYLVMDLYNLWLFTIQVNNYMDRFIYHCYKFYCLSLMFLIHIISVFLQISNIKPDYLFKTKKKLLF